MRVLGHVHTFNDERVIDRCLRSLMDQSCPVEEIVLVDNASSDNTLARSFPPTVTVIRHRENLGTSGAVISGMKYALEREFDWIWIFDADSAARPDALERLLAFYRGLDEAVREKIQTLASVPANPEYPYHGIEFTSRGSVAVELDSRNGAYECDAVIWSGSLFRVATIRAVGLPSADYVLDLGEFAYGYQGRVKGYKTFVIQESRFDQNTDNERSYYLAKRQVGPFRFNVATLPEARLYYLVRNQIYFWFYEYRGRTWRFYLQAVREGSGMAKQIMKLFLLRRWTELDACVRGIWDGVVKNMHHRY